MADGGKIIIKIDGDSKMFENSIDNVKKGIGTLNKGFAITGAAATAALGVATKVGMEFETQMSTVGAISQASAQDMQLLTDKAKEMGIQSAFSAESAGQAMEYMAMAGWKTEEMLNGVEGIMNLAAASGEDLATTSDIVTDAMTAFGLSADKSGEFADVLAAASSNANTNVGLMGETFKYVAPVAGALGFSVQDTTIAIGLMANAGIKGSQAGTALRQTISRMAKPTAESAQAMETLGVTITKSDGSMKSFNEIMVDIRKGMSNMTADQKASTAAMLGGQEAMSGLLAIANASERDFQKLTSAIDNSTGSAKKMADTKLDNLRGQITLLGSSMEGLGIAIYDKFGDGFKNVVKSAIEWVNKLTEKLSNGELDKIIAGITAAFVTMGVTIAALNIAIIIDDITRALRGQEAATKLVAAAQAAWNAVKALDPIYLWATAITAVTVGIIAYAATLDRTTEEEKAFKEAVEEQTEAINNNAEATKQRRYSLIESTNASLSEISYLQTIASELDNLTDANGRVKEGYEGRAQFILNELNSALGTEYTMTEGLIQKNGELKQTIFDLIEAKKLEALMEAGESEWTEAIKNKAQLEKDLKDAYIANQEVLEKRKVLEEEVAKYANINSLTYAIAKESLEIFDEENKEVYQNLKTAQNAFDENAAAISGYENALEIARGSASEGLKAFEDFYATLGVGTTKTKDYAEGTEEYLADLGTKIVGATQYYTTALENFNKNQNAATTSMLEDSSNKLSELLKQYTDAGGKTLNGYITAFNTNGKSTKVDINPILEELGKAETEAKSKGLDLSKGYAKGITDGEISAINAAVAVAVAAIKAIKDTQDSNSPAKESMYKGEDFSDGYALGIRKNSGKAIAAVRNMVEGAMSELTGENETEVEKFLNSLTKKQLPAEKQYQEAVTRTQEEYNQKRLDNDEYYKAEKKRIDKLQKENRKTYTDEQRELDAEYLENLKKNLDDKLKTLKDANDEELKRLKGLSDIQRGLYDAMQKDMKNRQKELADTYKDIAKDMLDNIEEVEKAEQEFARKLKDYGELYTTKTQKFGDREVEIVNLADLDKQTKTLEKYAENLNKVKDRGDVSPEFFSMLRDMSIDEGLKFSDALLKANDKDFDEYIQSWKDKQKAADELSEFIYFDDAKKVMDENEAIFDKFSEDLAEKGKEGAKRWGEGFIEQMQAQMSDLWTNMNNMFGGIVASPALAAAGGGTVTNYTTYTEKAPVVVDATVELDGRTVGNIVLKETTKEAQRQGTSIITR